MDSPYLLSDQGVRFGLRRNFATRIGREFGNDIIVGDTTVSSHHATITASNRAFRLHDANSSNGCYVNGRRVGEATLHDGDFIQFGGASFTFCSGQSEAAALLCAACGSYMRQNAAFCSRCGNSEGSTTVALRPMRQIIQARQKAPSQRRSRHPILTIFGIGLLLFLIALPFLPLLVVQAPSGVSVTDQTPLSQNPGEAMVMWFVFVVSPVYGFCWRWIKRVLAYLFLRKEAYDLADHIIDRAKS